MEVVSLIVDNASPCELPRGAYIESALPSEKEGLPVLAALANNDLVPLDMPARLDMTLHPVTLADPHGWHVYRRTLCFLVAKVVDECFPEVDCRIRQSIGRNALYWTLDLPLSHREAAIATIKANLQALIARDEPIHHRVESYENILKMFRQKKMWDKVNLLAHRNPPYLALAVCGGFSDLPQGVLTTRTGKITAFDIVPMHEGFVLHFPDVENPHHVERLPPSEELFEVYSEHLQWGEIIGVRNAGELNAAIADGSVSDVINTVEALHEKRLANLADRIAAQVPRPHVVLIAGPSSAGKTTSAMRLCTHLKVLGLKPTLISTDNYFVGDALNPKGADGKPDYEHIDAINRPQLNADILALLRGETVPYRRFDFHRHENVMIEGKTLTLDKRLGVLVIEGIHSLNPLLTEDIPREEKFLIYVNALTQLAIDRNNRISTIDNRLLRRLVRDGQFRGRSVLETLQLWPKVRAGEEKWIFPFQCHADAVFNTALDYEIPVLKGLAAPLLNQIKPSHPEYAVARRLTGFLQNFASMPMADVPTNSILREYLGASRLKY